MPEIRAVSTDIKQLKANIKVHANGPAFRRELSRELNSASKPVREAMKAQIPAALPNRGGLAARMHSMVSSSTSSARGGVSIRFRSKGYDIRTLVSGRIRRPLFGNRKHWFTQTEGADPEEFTGEFERQRPVIKEAVEDAVEDIARKVTNI